MTIVLKILIRNLIVAGASAPTANATIKEIKKNNVV